MARGPIVIRTNAFAQDLEDVLQRVAERAFGDRARRLAEIGRAVKELSIRYQNRRGADLDDELQLAARLLFFTPADLPKIGYPLAELAALELLPPGPLRVLDLGAGCGAQTLGIAARLADRVSPREMLIDAVDRDGRALALMNDVCREIDPSRFGVKLQCKSEVADVCKYTPRRPPYDLIVVGTTLAEIPEARHYALVAGIAEALSPSGALIIIEPALKETARALGRLRDRLLEGQRLTVFAPCTHSSPCPMLSSERDWCHESRIAAAPARLRRLASLTGLRRRDLNFSYLTLRAGSDNVSALAPCEVARRVVSSVRRSKGRRELYVCGASGIDRLVALDRHRTVENRRFADLHRGELIGVEGEEPGLRIGAETKVKAIDPGA